LNFLDFDSHTNIPLINAQSTTSFISHTAVILLTMNEQFLRCGCKSGYTALWSTCNIALSEFDIRSWPTLCGHPTVLYIIHLLKQQTVPYC